MTDQLKSWAVIDRNGEEFISAKSIFFSAAKDTRRAKHLAQVEADYINDDEGLGTVTVELRPVNKPELNK